MMVMVVVLAVVVRLEVERMVTGACEGAQTD
jgi:hypothetical protein